ncbi:MAG: ACP S-malonyltransferase [Chloroflexi bacterium]|nr:ACP S-malonyltransferase [Chloroflexota bacterium]
MRFALLFPGQASQHVGMAADVLAGSTAARELFALTDRLTGLPVAEVAHQGPLETLTRTEYAQPAVVATSLAFWLTLRERLDAAGVPLMPDACAGHSVGELAAACAAGALGPEQAIRLVTSRSQLMAAACRDVDGSMAAVIGLDEATLERVCLAAFEATATRLELANLNAPDQLVVSGHRSAIDWLAEHAREFGARRVLPVKVSGPFHSSYMRGAAARFAAAVAAEPFATPTAPLVLNQTAAPSIDPAAIQHELATAVAAPVRWSASLRAMAGAGCELFIEVGSGQVLAGLVRRTLPGAEVVSTSDLAGVDRAAELLMKETLACQT